ncbi:hypothetical protein KAI78_06455 [bacterium]|nr:hypothetical protein [bacterium]
MSSVILRFFEVFHDCPTELAIGEIDNDASQRLEDRGWRLVGRKTRGNGQLEIAG